MSIRGKRYILRPDGDGWIVYRDNGTWRRIAETRTYEEATEAACAFEAPDA